MPHEPAVQLDWLRGRAGVVSGGAAGIGKAVTARLTAAGAKVLIADIDVPAGQQTAQQLGGRFIAADLSTPDGVRAMMAAAQHELGRLVDLLVNNVGGLLGPAYPQASPQL
jgi:NAD(P)-dependent dehydrogenase (short-subunit alcohol dehydrogenase family)